MTSQKELQKRYEQMRQQCLKQGNMHPDSPDVCHIAIQPYARGLEYHLAALLDDMYLYLCQSEPASVPYVVAWRDPNEYDSDKAFRFNAVDVPTRFSIPLVRLDAMPVNASVRVEDLPELPESLDEVRCMMRGDIDYLSPCDDYYSQDQMRDYALSAIRALSPPVQPAQALTDEVLMKVASHAYNLGRDAKGFKDEEVRDFVRSLTQGSKP